MIAHDRLQSRILERLGTDKHIRRCRPATVLQERVLHPSDLTHSQACSFNRPFAQCSRFSIVEKQIRIDIRNDNALQNSVIWIGLFVRPCHWPVSPSLINRV